MHKYIQSPSFYVRKLKHNYVFTETNNKKKKREIHENE